MLSLIDEVIQTKIGPEEILYVVKEMARLHDEKENPNWYSAMAILSDRYRGTEQPHRVACIMERMQCLAKLSTDERMHGWSTDGIEADCLLTNEAVYRATALCLLRQDSNRFYFDPDEFFKIVLQESEPEGRA